MATFLRSRKARFGIVASMFFAINTYAHDEPTVQLNNQSCPGTLYTVGHWQISTSSITQIDDPNGGTCYRGGIARDNCGQFDYALAYTTQFCHVQTDAFAQLLGYPEQRITYHGPVNFLEPSLRQTYSIEDGIELSCQLCVAEERIRFMSESGAVKHTFAADEDVYMFWWRLSPFWAPANTSSPYQNYQVTIQSRPIGSNKAFSRQISTLTNGLFPGTSNLSELANLRACYQYKVTVTLNNQHGNSIHSEHFFTVVDQLTCPYQAEPVIGNSNTMQYES